MKTNQSSITKDNHFNATLAEKEIATLQQEYPGLDFPLLLLKAIETYRLHALVALIDQGVYTQARDTHGYASVHLALLAKLPPFFITLLTLLGGAPSITPESRFRYDRDPNHSVILLALQQGYFDEAKLLILSRKYQGMYQAEKKAINAFIEGALKEVTLQENKVFSKDEEKQYCLLKEIQSLLKALHLRTALIADVESISFTLPADVNLSPSEQLFEHLLAELYIINTHKIKPNSDATNWAFNPKEWLLCNFPEMLTDSKHSLSFHPVLLNLVRNERLHKNDITKYLLYFLQHDPNFTSSIPHGRALFSFAIDAYSEQPTPELKEILFLLINKGHFLHQKNLDHLTPLQEILLKGDSCYSFVDILLTKGVEFPKEDLWKNEFILAYASLRGQALTIAYLLQQEVDIYLSHFNTILNHTPLPNLVKNVTAWKYLTMLPRTTLEWAVTGDSLPLLPWLLDSSLFPEINQSYLKQLFFLATHYRSKNTAMFLLSQKALDRLWQTSEMMAELVYSGPSSLIQHFVDKAIAPITAAMVFRAMQTDHLGDFTLLLGKLPPEALTESVSNRGTLLHEACYRANYEMVEALVHASESLFAQEKESLTKLLFNKIALQKLPFYKVPKELFLQLKNSQGNTALQLALYSPYTSKGRLKIIEFFYEKSSPEAHIHYLCEASGCWDVEVISFLIQKGVSPTALNHEGESPLVCAFMPKVATSLPKHSLRSTVNFLLAKGAMIGPISDHTPNKVLASFYHYYQTNTYNNYDYMGVALLLIAAIIREQKAQKHADSKIISFLKDIAIHTDFPAYHFLFTEALIKKAFIIEPFLTLHFKHRVPWTEEIMRWHEFYKPGLAPSNPFLYMLTTSLNARSISRKDALEIANTYHAALQSFSYQEQSCFLEIFYKIILTWNEFESKYLKDPYSLKSIIPSAPDEFTFKNGNALRTYLWYAYVKGHLHNQPLTLKEFFFSALDYYHCPEKCDAISQFYQSIYRQTTPKSTAITLINATSEVSLIPLSKGLSHQLKTIVNHSLIADAKQLNIPFTSIGENWLYFLNHHHIEQFFTKNDSLICDLYAHKYPKEVLKDPSHIDTSGKFASPRSSVSTPTKESLLKRVENLSKGIALQ